MLIRVCLPAVGLTGCWQWPAGLRCQTGPPEATPPAAGKWAVRAASEPASLCCWCGGIQSRPAGSAVRCSWNTAVEHRQRGRGRRGRSAKVRWIHANRKTHTQAKYYRADLREMARHGLAGTQSQTILCCLGQVVQQAEGHRGYVELVGHAVLQPLSAAGKLAGKGGDSLSFNQQPIMVKQQETHTPM